MKEEKEKNQKEQTQADPPKKNWRQMISERNPDLNMEDEDALSDYMSSQFSQLDESNRQLKEFNDVLASDEHAAYIIDGLATGMANGEKFSLAKYLIENYGDIIANAASTEEAVEMAKKREAENVKKAADEAKRKSELMDNIKKADEMLTEAVKKANVDEANVSEMLTWLYGTEDKEGLLHRIVKYELDADDWLRLIFAFNRDNDIRRATDEGRRMAKRPSGSSMHRNMRQAPTDLGGSSAREAPADVKQEDPTLSAYGRMKRRV